MSLLRGLSLKYYWQSDFIVCSYWHYELDVNNLADKTNTFQLHLGIVRDMK